MLLRPSQKPDRSKLEISGLLRPFRTFILHSHFSIGASLEAQVSERRIIFASPVTTRHLLFCALLDSSHEALFSEDDQIGTPGIDRSKLARGGRAVLARKQFSLGRASELIYWGPLAKQYMNETKYPLHYVQPPNYLTSGYPTHVYEKYQSTINIQIPGPPAFSGKRTQFCGQTTLCTSDFANQRNCSARPQQRAPPLRPCQRMLIYIEHDHPKSSRITMRKMAHYRNDSPNTGSALSR